MGEIGFFFSFLQNDSRCHRRVSRRASTRFTLLDILSAIAHSSILLGVFHVDSVLACFDRIPQKVRCYSLTVAVITGI